MQMSFDKRLKLFRFEMAWMQHAQFSQFINKEWSFDVVAVSSSLLDFSIKLANWNKEVFGNIFFRKHCLLARLNGIQKRLCVEYIPYSVKLEKDLIKEFNVVLTQEKSLWF